MPGKRPRQTMRRIPSVSLIGSGSMTAGDCSPLPEHPKEKLKSSNMSISSSHCAALASIPPRQVIGFHPKVFIEDEHHLVLPPTSPRPQHQQQAKSPTGSSGSPRSGLGDLLANGSRPWERRDEGVGLGIVAALGASQEDTSSANGVNINTGRGGGASPAYTRKTQQSGFAPAKTSPPIPIHSPGSNSPSSHHCPSSHQRYPPQNCAPHFGLSSAMQESMMMQDISNSHRVGPSGRVSHGHGGGGAAPPMLPTWSHQAENMEVEALLSLASSPKPSYLPTLPAGLNFLDACFYCKRRLGEGRDIYMYRGDKAFCSPECRHQQIVMDERPEKCSQAVIRIGGVDASRHTSQRNRVVAAGTAAAA